MFNKTIICVAIASLGSGFAGQAVAGAASSAGQQFSMLVQDQGGSSWSPDLTGLMSFNASTGALSFDASKVASPVDDQLGEWSIAAAGSKDVDGTVLTTDRVKWHSWERADGTTGTTTSADNPWASVFTFTASANVDPFMTYGFTAKNNTASTQTYTYTMGEALSPTVNGDYVVSANVSGAIVNGTGANVTITPTLADEDGDGISELQVLRLSNDGGATFVNAGVDVGQKDVAPSSHVYGLYNQTGSGTGSFNYWAVETQFTLTSGGDVASLAGYAEITPVETAPVPEPESYALMLMGLGLVGAIARKRQR